MTTRLTTFVSYNNRYCHMRCRGFRFISVLFFTSLAIFCNKAFAILDIELTKGTDDKKSIAVIQFSGEESLTNNKNKISEIISSDLKNSGRFKLAENNNNSVQNLYGTSGSLNYDFWKAGKVENVVIGSVKSPNNNQFEVSFKLFDIYGKTVLLEKKYKEVETTKLRSLAHHISDLIYEKLTGIRGIFSTKIAYVLVKRDGAVSTYSLEVVDADGENTNVLLTSDSPIMSPAWSPDGKRLAYVSFEGNRSAIYIQDLATGNRNIVSKCPGINGAPAWSSDGKKLAIVLSTTGYPKIYVIDVSKIRGENFLKDTEQSDKGVLEQITYDWYLDTEPSWAPDGKSLIFTSNRGGNPQIYRYYFAGKKVNRITYDGNYNARASFTNKAGDRIVMLHGDDAMLSVAIQDLMNNKVNSLIKSDFNESPNISPNGQMIVYSTNLNGARTLAVVSIDGKVQLNLPSKGGDVQEPAWSPFMD